MAPSAEQTHDHLRTRFLALIFGYALLDFGGPMLLYAFGSWFFITIWLGFLAGQGLFLIIWAVLGPFRLWVRWSIILTTAIGLYVVLIFGLIIFSGSSPRGEEVLVALIGSLLIPLLFLLAQIPLWLRRLISGWRIVAADDAEQCSAVEARQFGLGHLLGLMVALAVSLSLIRVCFVVLPFDSAEDAAGVLAYLGSIFFVFILYVVVWAGPSLRAVFLARRRGRGCAAIIGYWALISFLLVGIPSGIALAFGEVALPAAIAVTVFTHFAGILFILVPSLYALQACEYVMIHKSKKRRTETPLAAAGMSPFAEPASQSDLPSNEAIEKTSDDQTS